MARTVSVTQAQALAERLHGHLRLSDLMAGVHSRCGIHCAATLRLTAELVNAGWLAQRGPTTPSPTPLREVQPAPLLTPAHKTPQATSTCATPTNADGECWMSTWLLSGLLNACARREEAVVTALHDLTAALLATPEGTPARLAFERLASHPWQRFTFEMTFMHRRQLPSAVYAYWRLILMRRPSWTAELAARKPDCFRELLAKLLHAPTFGEAEFGLLAAVNNLPGALDAPLRAEAIELLRFRVREPSAARFGPESDRAPEEDTIEQWCGNSGTPPSTSFCVVAGVVVPVALLRAAAACNGDSVPSAARQADYLRQAEQQLVESSRAEQGVERRQE